ncbi:hypothetical protein [Bacillus sp. Marseille-P3800]|uniref:hypothetical protein n=1 Tax=Bacillus sp. Marseille-P3800 TaxID=2014782 RepID=UPI00159B9EC8|nr:hypothetical protein [Bacillus sp. Marseille-P3800]
MDVEKAKEQMDVAVSEINLALNSSKSKEVKQFYLENAIHFIERAKFHLSK